MNQTDCFNELIHFQHLQNVHRGLLFDILHILKYFCNISVGKYCYSLAYLCLLQTQIEVNIISSVYLEKD